VACRNRAAKRRQQRAAALGAILSNAASLTIFGIAAVIIIGDMGLNPAPVLASSPPGPAAQ
jgi:moderate conductance mechanosensitive channel